MAREEHEALLNELLGSELEQSRRTEILQQLRVDYTDVHTQFTEISQSNKKLQTDNDDLVISNSKLFRQLGVVGGNPEEKKKEEVKEFSETVTIEALERG
jgi:regulator of replication initiation timing